MMCKKARFTLSLAALLYVAFPQVKYINLSEIVRLVKAVALLRSVNLKLSTLFVVSRFLSVSPKGRLNPVFRPRKKCPFPLNRGVPSIGDNRYQDYLYIFPEQNFVSPEWSCPLNKGVPNIRRGSTWFHFKRNISTKHMLAKLSVP